MLKQGILSNGLRRIREGCRGSAGILTVDVDDVPLLADGHQPGSRYCGHVGHRGYSALVAVSGESGDILCARLHRPEQDRAGDTFDSVLTIVDGALGDGGWAPGAGSHGCGLFRSTDAGEVRSPEDPVPGLSSSHT